MGTKHCHAQFYVTTVSRSRRSPSPEPLSLPLFQPSRCPFSCLYDYHTSPCPATYSCNPIRSHPSHSTVVASSVDTPTSCRVFRLNTGAIIREGIVVLPSVKGDLFAAKNYFMLALSKDPNKRILYQLSMLKRKMAQGKHLRFLVLKLLLPF
ncbi:hypothetical protein ZIOFF_009894 [Zingiber officinale]|uniref:Uncharacterized protein n=1 Tax=Zingiber officinale TaxID=94328 RepID=A0A8J5LP14_ZINOF|nr:hypothetical protein ZIOFF_009894 [Zingiber officinale]